MTVAWLWTKHHTQVAQIAIRHWEHQHQGVVVSVSLEPDREVPDVRGGVTEHEERNEDETEDAEAQGEVLTSGLWTGQLYKRGQDTTKIVSAVEGQEAGDRSEVNIGPDVGRVWGVLRGHQNCDTGEDCQGGEEDEEHAQYILPALGQDGPVLCQRHWALSGQVWNHKQKIKRKA